MHYVSFIIAMAAAILTSQITPQTAVNPQAGMVMETEEAYESFDVEEPVPAAQAEEAQTILSDLENEVIVPADAETTVKEVGTIATGIVDPAVSPEADAFDTVLSAEEKLAIYDAGIRSIETADELRCHDLCERLANGELVQLNNVDEVNMLACYYNDKYAIWNLNDAEFACVDHTALRVRNPRPGQTRAEVVDAIIKAFPDYSGLKGDQLMYQICKDVHSRISFSSSRTYDDMLVVLNSGSGVCTHYATCVSVLATYYGEPCKLVAGKRKASLSSMHSWNKTAYRDWDACMSAGGSTTDSYIEISNYPLFE